MKNFKDIGEINSPSYIISSEGKFTSSINNINYNISQINVIPQSLIFGGKSILLGDNLTFNNNILNYTIKSFCNSQQIFGEFSNLEIKDNSLLKSNLFNVETNKILSTGGQIIIGDGLNLSQGVISKESNQINLETGLITLENPSTISQNGIYILDVNTFTNIILEPELIRVYIINVSNTNILLNSDIIIYSGEICLISLNEKIKTNNVGSYTVDNSDLITNNLNTIYSDGDLVITNVERYGTENNPVIYLYTIYKDVEISIRGPNDVLLTKDTNYTYSYNEVESRFEILFIEGSSSEFFGTYEPGGFNLTGNDGTTNNGIYKIYINEFLQESKKVCEIEINTQKSIIIGNNIIQLDNPQLTKTGNIFSNSIGNNISVQSCQINNTNYTIGSTFNFGGGTLVIQTNGDYSLNLSKKSILDLPEINVTGIDSNFVTDSGTVSFSMVKYLPNINNELKISNSTIFNINIFDYFNFYGENLIISGGVLNNQSVSGFGTISLTSTGNLTINPEAFSTNTYTLNFEVSGQKNYSVPLKLYFNDANTTTHWKISLNGCFSEIKFKDSIDSNYKTLNNSNGVSSITRVNNESTGIEIQENGTFFDGNYYRGIDDLFLSIEDELLDPANNISDREYTTSSLRDGTNLPKSTYIIVFNSPIRITELLISPSVNNNTFMPLPNTLSLFKSLDNGNTWLKISDYSINEENIPIEWYPYIVGVENKLNALYQTGGFFRIII